VNHMTKQRLPHRALICPYKQIIHYETEYLRTVANRYGINSNRREFYRMCQALALQYYVDLMNEYDFYALGHVKTVYRRALAIGRRFAVSLDRRTRGGGPPYVEISRRCVRYRRRDLIPWLDALSKPHTSAKTASDGQRKIGAAPANR
jgi:hypothetical protein